MRKLILFLIFVLCLASFASAISTSDAQFYFSFDNASMSGDTALDETGFQDGQVYGATSGIVGKLGEAISTDGINDYFNTNHTVDNFTGANCLNFWLATNSTASKEWGYYSGGAQYFILWNTNGYGNGQELYFELANTVYGAFTNTSYVDGNWHMHTLCKDGTYVHWWLDGTNLTSVASATGDTSGSTYFVFLGARSIANVPSSFTQSVIDEVSLWNKELSPTEIGELYNNGTGYNPFGLAPTCINDTDCGLCEKCNNSACIYQSLSEDVKNECSVNLTCSNAYTILAQDGFCNGVGACSIAYSNVSAGDVCYEGTSSNPNATTNCGTWQECIATQYYSNEFYVGYVGDGTAVCVATDWQAIGTNLTYADTIRTTENASSCKLLFKDWFTMGMWMNRTGYDGVAFTQLQTNVTSQQFNLMYPKPIINNGRIYGGGWDGANGYEFILNATTLNLTVIYYFGNFQESTAIIAGGYVYFGGGNGNFYQLSATDLSVIAYYDGEMTYSSPALWNNSIYFADYAGRVYQLDAYNVSNRIGYYDMGQNGHTEGNPTIETQSNGTTYLYVSSTEGILFKFNLNTGNISTGLVDSLNISAYRILSAPTILDDYLYIASWDGNAYQINKTDLSIVETFVIGAQVWNAFATDGTSIYITSVGDQLLKLDANNISIKLANLTVGGTYGGPVVAGGSVFFGSGSNLYQVNATDLTLIMNISTGGIVTAISVAEGYVYFVSYDGYVRKQQIAGSFLACVNDSDCGICQKCSANVCVNQTGAEDLKGECSASYDYCTNAYVRLGSSGLCNGYAACSANDTQLNVSAGNVCIAGADANPTSGVNCGIWSDCVQNATWADEYYVGYVGDGTAVCVDTDWQAAGTFWNVTIGYLINVTEHADTCQEVSMSACNIIFDGEVEAGTYYLNGTNCTLSSPQIIDSSVVLDCVSGELWNAYNITMSGSSSTLRNCILDSRLTNSGSNNVFSGNTILYAQVDEAQSKIETPIEGQVLSSGVRVNLTLNYSFSTYNKTFVLLGLGKSATCVLLGVNDMNCTLLMNFYDAPGIYDYNVTVFDSIGSRNKVFSSVYTYNELLASQRDRVYITFSTAFIGNNNVSSDYPIEVTNLGNKVINTAAIIAHDVPGATVPSEKLLASYFRAGANLGSSVQLADNVEKDITFNLNTGANSSLDFYIWVSAPSTLYPQTYISSVPWQLILE